MKEKKDADDKGACYPVKVIIDQSKSVLDETGDYNPDGIGPYPTATNIGD